MPRFSCPKCKTTLEATAEQAGQVITCHQCQTQMKVPSSVPQPPPAQPAPPPLPAHTEQEWHYAKNGQRVGPVTEADLKALIQSGQLSPSDMVWKQGMTQWTEARSIPGLISEARTHAPSPPPLPSPMPWPDEDRDSLSVLQKIGIGVASACLILGLFCLIGTLFTKWNWWIFSPVFLLAVPLILFLWVFNGWTTRGRWVPADGAGGWVEFLMGGGFKREDGVVGRFVLCRNKKFIDIFVAGRLMDSWKILSWGEKSLEVQDMSGKARSFKLGKTLEEKQRSFFHQDRTDDLPGTWMPIDGSGKWIQFTKDGAAVFSDGGAGRYTVTGEEPNESIQVTMADRSTRKYRVMSLSKVQLVIVDGTKASTFTRHGTKASATSSTSSEQSSVTSADPPAEQGTSSGVGGFLSSAWNWLAGKQKCRFCKSRNTQETSRTLEGQRQVVKTDWSRADSRTGHRPQAHFNVKTWEVAYKCLDCAKEWCQDEETGEMA